MQLAQNLLDFVKSLPTSFLIFFAIGIILRLLGKPFSTIAKIFTLYVCIWFLLALFGIHLPTLPQIFIWIKDFFVSLYHKVRV